MSYAVFTMGVPEMSETPTYDGLSTKRKQFIDAYAGLLAGGMCRFNATASARFAGYKHPNVQGPRLLGKDGIRPAINERLTQFAMSDEEAATIIAEHAKGTMRPFLKRGLNDQLEVDLSTAKARKNIHLIKKIKQKKRVLSTGDDEIKVLEIETEIEIHDAKDAAHKIRQAHGA